MPCFILLELMHVDEGTYAIDQCTSMATLSTSTTVGSSTDAIVDLIRADACKDGTMNAMEVDASSNAYVDGNVIDAGTNAIVDSIGVDAGKDGIGNALEVNANSNAIIDGNVSNGGTYAILDVVDDIEVMGIDAIFQDTKDMGQEALTNRGARIDGIGNALEVNANSNANIDGNVSNGGTCAILDVVDDIEVVGIDAIFQDTKDMGHEALTNRGARIGEATLKTNVMAQDKAVCQTNVAGLAIDVQAIHDDVLKDVEPDKLEKATLSTSTTVSFVTNAIVDPMVVDAETYGIVYAIKVGASTDIVVDDDDNELLDTYAIFGDRKGMGEEALIDRGARMDRAIHDGVLRGVEPDKLEKATLSTSTIVGSYIDAIVDPMAVDAKKNDILNAMKVDASINATVDGTNVNDDGIDIMIDANDPIVDATEAMGV
ncbi:hypothetical protein L7F22_054283 [Adiantum nelumboides]|nr:hypothetical protein [Adiantum nelumboides]MCO5600175.1 hypothetical protein [Adiantum nelumboides]